MNRLSSANAHADAQAQARWSRTLAGGIARDDHLDTRKHRPGRGFIDACLTVTGVLIAWIACAGPTEAAPVRIVGLNAQWPLETRADLGGATGDALDDRVPLGAMARFGVQADVLTDGARLSRPGFALEYHTDGGWRGATEGLAALPAPVQAEGQLWLPVRALASLGFNVRLEGANILVEALPETPEVPNQVVEFRLNKGRSSRLVLNLGRIALPVSSVEPGRVRVVLPNTLIQPRFMSVGAESVSRLRAVQDGPDAVIEVEIALRAAARAFVIPDPDRLIIDAETPDEVPPAPGTPPAGATLTTGGEETAKLSLVTLEPSRFKPAVVVAPWGGTRSVLEHAQRAGAAVAVNGGYFDPASGLPVDLTVAGGSVLAYARGNRASLGWLEGGVLFGTPRVRMTVNPEGALSVNVNSVQPRPNPTWLTAFVGDGFVSVGAPGFVTLVVGPQPVVNGASRIVVLERRTDAFTPAPGLVTLSFSPAAFPNLDRIVPGSPINLSLTWADAAWANVSHALAAGPMLVRGGQYAVNAALEGFDTSAEIWRATRQVAFGLDAQGRYVVAMLEQGTPEQFARALIAAGLVNAVRLDSGSSAAVYVAGGMLSGRWGRTVPNALVFVPR